MLDDCGLGDPAPEVPVISLRTPHLGVQWAVKGYGITNVTEFAESRLEVRFVERFLGGV